MNRTWLWCTLGAAALCVAALALGGRSERAKTGAGAGDGDAVGESVASTGRASWWSGGIPARPVDSAALAEFADNDDWEEIGAEGRMARVTETVDSLEQQLEAATSDEQRELLRDQALKVLASARSDFFVDPKSRQWYLDREAGLEAE
jgi:hypothetical protein